MERGNGPFSPLYSICEVQSLARRPRYVMSCQHRRRFKVSYMQLRETAPKDVVVKRPSKGSELGIKKG